MSRSRGTFLGLEHPPAGSKKSSQLKYVRDLELRLAAVTLFLCLFAALVVGGGVPLIAAGVGGIFYAAHSTWLTISARRLDTRGP